MNLRQSKKMKKICFIIPRSYYLFNPEAKNAKDKVGGAQKQAYFLSTALAEDKNFDVHFLVADFGQNELEERQHVKLQKSFNFSDNIFKRTRKLLKTLKKIKAETYIFRTADTGVAFAIFFVQIFLKRKVIYMIAADAETSKKRQKKYNGFMTAFAMQYVYKKADIITAQTEQQSYIFEKNRKRKPDAIIKNIYLNENSENVNYNKKNTILWVGRLSEIKKPELFLKLAEKFPSEKFVMIAPVVLEKKEYGKKIQNKAKSIKNLQYIDYVKPEEIKNHYLKAKIYVTTSYLEGFSNTMAEAMQAGCPIISYNVNPDNILTKYECGFCADKKIEQLFSDFEKLNHNPKLRKFLGQNAAQYIYENHQKEMIIKEFKKLLL